MSVMKIQQNTYMFGMILLGILGYYTFFSYQTGISMLLFITLFYTLFFMKFPFHQLNHRRFSMFLLVGIWLLSASFTLFGKTVFYDWNKVLIPLLLFFHIIIVTRKNTFHLGVEQILQIIISISSSMYVFWKEWVQRFWQIGIRKWIYLVSFIVIIVISIRVDLFIFIFSSLTLSIFLYSLFEILKEKHVHIMPWKHFTMKKNERKYIWVGITLSIISFIIFIFVQNNDLLFFVYSIFIWTFIVLIYFYFALAKIKHHSLMQRMIYSIITVIHGVFVYLALHEILKQYESVWTVNSFIGFVMLFYILILLLYTFIRIWLSKIALTHFYFILGFICYVSLNIIQVEHFVLANADNHSIDHLEELSNVGYNELMRVYNTDDNGKVDEMLFYHYVDYLAQHRLFSYNFADEQFVENYQEWIKGTRSSEE